MKHMAQHASAGPLPASENYASATSKFLAAPGLLLTTALSALVLAAHASQWSSSRGLLAAVTLHRGEVATAVQVISTLLGGIHIYALCETINLSMRRHFQRRSTSLDTLKSLNALSANRFDWSLPWVSRILVLAFIVLTIAPAALWAGAITPVVVTRTKAQSMPIPNCANATGFLSHSETSLHTGFGTFTYFPDNPPLQGLLLDSASDASFITSSQYKHAKLDKTGYTYIGRSYGVGAAVGLSDFDLDGGITGYNYTERGFMANTNCIYNQSSAILFDSAGAPEGWLLQVYNVAGQLPNMAYGDNFEYTSVGFHLQNMVAGPTNAGDDGTYFMGFAVGNSTGSSFAPLDKAQCQTTFDPWEFSVLVNRTEKTIVVDPVSPIENGTWAAGYDSMIVRAYYVPYQIQAFLSAALWNPIYAGPFMNNIQNVEQFTTLKGDAANLQGIGDAFTSIIDNTMVLLLSAQIVLPNDGTAPTSVQSQYPALEFGTPVFIYAIFIVNILVCAIFIAEAVRTKGWHRVLEFDFKDVKSVVIAASAGGDAVYRAVSDKGQWRGKGDDLVAGRTRVRLDPHTLTIVLDQGGQSAENATRPRKPDESHEALLSPGEPHLGLRQQDTIKLATMNSTSYGQERPYTPTSAMQSHQTLDSVQHNPPSDQEDNAR